MDLLRGLLETLKEKGTARGHLRGLMHLLIARRISLADGAPVSAGLTWRALATQLKQVRWDPDAVQELGLDPDALPPRDRQRFWYGAITQAGVDSDAARQSADKLTAALKKLGYVVESGPAEKKSS